MKKRIPDSEQGFTLIETMVALFILVVGVMSLYSMQIGAIKGNTTATSITWGTAWVTDQIEYLINQPYDNPDKKGSLDPLEDTAATGAHGPITSPDGRYSITWTVAEDQLMNNLKTLAITVQYTDGGIQKSMVMDYIKPTM